MPTRSAPLFCGIELAQRIEAAEVDLIRAANTAAERRHVPAFRIPVAGGLASFAGDGSPYNKVVGLGFEGVPDAEVLDRVERAFAEHGAPTQVELAHLGEPAVGELLTQRGYRLESFENVLGRSVNEPDPPVTVPGVEIRASDDAEFDAWLAVMVDAVEHPDTQGLAWREEFPRSIYEAAMRDARGAGVRRYAAIREGALAGGAELRVVDGVAQFAGAATAPAHRRRGIQNALLSARLAVAAAEGCDVAVIVTQPGSKSQQNAQRQGFDLLYTRAVLVKPGESASSARATCR